MPLVLFLAGCVRARAPERDPRAPLREVTLIVEAEVNGIPPDAKELKLWIPVPRDEGSQVLTRVIPEAPGQPVVVTDTRHGNPALLVVLRSPASSTTARVSFEVSRAEQRGAGVSHPFAHEEKRGDPDLWLADESLGRVDDRVREIAAELFEPGMSDPAKARAAFEYVLANMRYAKEGEGWGTGSVAWACTMKYGNCTDFHALFIALLRAAQVPARSRIGFSLPVEREDGEGTIGGYHCWAEWWNPEHGWTPIDASEAWKHPERKERLFGSLDSDRIGISLGRDLVFEGQQGTPLNFFVFPYAEVDGAPVVVETTVRFRDR